MKPHLFHLLSLRGNDEGERTGSAIWKPLALLNKNVFGIILLRFLLRPMSLSAISDVPGMRTALSTQDREKKTLQNTCPMTGRALKNAAVFGYDCSPFGHERLRTSYVRAMRSTKPYDK